MPRAGPPGAGGPLRADALRVAEFRSRVRGQPVHLLLQHAEIDAARAHTARSHFHRRDDRFSRLQQPRLSSDRRARGRRRQPGRDQHGRLVQALLSHVATLEARHSGGDLPHPPHGARRASTIPRGLKLAWRDASAENALRAARRRPSGRAPAGRRRTGHTGGERDPAP